MRDPDIAHSALESEASALNRLGIPKVVELRFNLLAGVEAGRDGESFGTGRKLLARAPFGKWRTLTFLAALRNDRIDAPCVLAGPINGQSFTAWVEQFLVPTLAPGDVIIMARLRASHGPQLSLGDGVGGSRLPAGKKCGWRRRS